MYHETTAEPEEAKCVRQCWSWTVGASKVLKLKEIEGKKPNRRENHFVHQFLSSIFFVFAPCVRLAIAATTVERIQIDHSIRCVLGRLRCGAVHSMAMHTAQVQRACHRSCCPMV